MAEGYDEPISDATKARARREGWARDLGLDPVEPEIRIYEPRRRNSIKAFKYEGTFPLAFLEEGETVGRVPGGPDGQIKIETRDGAFTVDLGWYVMRNGDGPGAISAERFEAAYEVSANA
ncbi:MAG: hypothetical protein KGL39_55010 [Patescibacteria group bacterium]|nr:hypothetical protein [Patescibacteria group bacterium]